MIIKEKEKTNKTIKTIKTINNSNKFQICHRTNNCRLCFHQFYWQILTHNKMRLFFNKSISNSIT